MTVAMERPTPPAPTADIPRVNRHRTLVAWQRSHELAVEVHRAASRLPASERFELGSQLRRAAVSAAANIAEGSGRYGEAEFAHGLSIALGSLSEVDALLKIARDVGYLDVDILHHLDELRDRASAAAWALQRHLRHAMTGKR